jgi:hypothetical protein
MRKLLNRKQRRETMRKIQSEDLSLDVLHPDVAGTDIGNESTMWQCRRAATPTLYDASDAPRPSFRPWPFGTQLASR